MFLFVASSFCCFSAIPLYHADELQKSWQILQAGLQPIASFQAAVTGNDVPVQVRELSRLFDVMLNQTMQAARSNPPMPIAKGGLGDVVAEIQKKYPAPEHHAQIMSRLCATIPQSRDWGERFCQLMALLSEQPTPAERHYLDRYLAEFVQVEGVVIEGGATQRNIAQQVGLIRDWVNGEKLEGKPEHADAWRRYNDLARTGGLLWTRDALRRLLLRELRRPDVNPNPPDLIQAIVDVDTLGSDIDTSMSCWRGDPEILDSLDQRIRSYLNRDQIQRMLIRHRQPTERISAVASMFSILRSLPNRDRFAEFAEEFLVVPALVKEMEIELAGRLAVVPPLLRFVTRLTVVDIDVECRDRLVDAFDNALADILEQEIWAVTGRKDVDKALALLRLWLPSPLKTGRCRDLVETALGKAIQKSEFFNTFLESYKHDKVRSKAAESLDQLLVEYGFKVAPTSA